MHNPPTRKIYNWDYTQCPWIDPVDVEADREVLSFEKFKAEYLGQWGAKVGGVYIHTEIDASIMMEAEMQALLADIQAMPTPVIQRAQALEWHDGIDWGDVHLTVDIEGFQWNEIVYITDMQTWNVEQNKRKDDVIDELVTFARRHPNTKVYSEAAPISTSDNYRFEEKLRGYGISLYRTAFGTVLDKDIDPKAHKGITKVPKESFVQTSIGRFNHGTVRINAKLKMLIKQLKNAVRDEKDNLVKGNDDCHDAFLHIMQSFRKKRGLRYHRRKRR